MRGPKLAVVGSGRHSHPFSSVRFLGIQDGGEQLPQREGWMTTMVFVKEEEEKELIFLNNLNYKK